MSKSDVKGLLFVLGVLLFVAHMLVITDDIANVINDPNEENKPREILKLAVDVTRYFG